MHGRIYKRMANNMISRTRKEIIAPASASPGRLYLSGLLKPKTVPAIDKPKPINANPRPT